MHINVSLSRAGTSILIALVLLVGCFAVIQSAQASAVVAPYNTYQVLAFNGITQTQSGYVLAQAYGEADCYARHTEATSGDPQTVTFSLYHSADASAAYSVSLYSYADQTTDTIAFTRALMYGNYLHARVDLAIDTRPITGAVICVLKNIQQ